MEQIRLDKWLCAVRVFKTRNQAADACRGGKVKIDGQSAKPSRDVKIGETIEIQLGVFKKTLRIKELVKNRVSAKLVPDLVDDLTPESELEKQEMYRQLNHERRQRGSGRPTKKERRDINKLKQK